MTTEFPSYESLPGGEEDVPRLSVEELRECLRKGAESARELKKQLDAIPPPDMSLVLR